MKLRLALIVCLLLIFSGCSSGIYNDRGLERLSEYESMFDIDLSAFTSPLPPPPRSTPPGPVPTNEPREDEYPNPPGPIPTNEPRED